MGELIASISRLSIADRIRLVQEILNTISDETETQKKALVTDQQWKEIKKRSEAITNRTAKTTSWDIIDAALTKRYDL